MAASYSVQVEGAEELRTFLDGIPDAQYRGARTAFSRAAFAAQKATLDNLDGSPMQTRTGALARSITPQVSGNDLGSLTGRIYSGMIYAPIHETGGTVVAKRAYAGVPGGPYLNIPTADNKTPAGVQRMTAQQVFAAGGHVFKSSSGRFGVMLDGKVMFMLVRQVSIRPQLGMQRAAEAQIPTLMSELQAMALE